MTVKTLAKLILIYNYLYITKQPTKIVQKHIIKFKKSFTTILKNRPDFYKKADTLHSQVYRDAWRNTTGPDDETRLVSLGHFIQVIWESINEPQKLITERQIDKILSSYYFSRSDNLNELQMEQEANKLGNEVVKLLDGEKGISKFQRRLTILKQNKRVEGK